jgi:hypothetical protein
VAIGKDHATVLPSGDTADKVANLCRGLFRLSPKLPSGKLATNSLLHKLLLVLALDSLTCARPEGLSMTKKQSMAIWGSVVLIILVIGSACLIPVSLGQQPDGSFLVSSRQRIEADSIAFTGRPIDLALHPREDVFAVLNKSEIFLATAEGAKQGTSVALGYETSAGFHGLI